MSFTEHEIRRRQPALVVPSLADLDYTFAILRLQCEVLIKESEELRNQNKKDLRKETKQLRDDAEDLAKRNIRLREEYMKLVESNMKLTIERMEQARRQKALGEWGLPSFT